MGNVVKGAHNIKRDKKVSSVMGYPSEDFVLEKKKSVLRGETWSKTEHKRGEETLTFDIVLQGCLDDPFI